MKEHAEGLERLVERLKERAEAAEADVARLLAENEALRGELGTLKATLLKGHGGYVGCEAANDELERLCRERDETREILRRLFKLGQPPGDWACAECRPGSEVLRVGFKCAYHAAAEVLT
jgi:regulator of replication initiation timing